MVCVNLTVAEIQGLPTGGRMQRDLHRNPHSIHRHISEFVMLHMWSLMGEEGLRPGSSISWWGALLIGPYLLP